ncbi:FAD-dependent oxidoreductase [Phaeacidiphilus oryzae]|uniref:FAD-dependent oxidoreductase n=1 Tax=Phaeacidiphilus oryzae TaxID=348818 RepID=UPI000563D561|nr:NAD(P)/FAD-dependent oxidoreductase [Phaeacidiphilus oryzae]
MGDVLVIGGGIAGPATALALQRAGLDGIEVFEAQPEGGADAGAFLTLAGNGVFALDQFGAAGLLDPLGFPVLRMSVLGADGSALAEDVPLGDAGDPLTHYRCLRRAELARALREEAVRRGIPVRHGARLTGIAPDDSGESVTALFADGGSATGRLLVGADGLRSAVRAALSPDAPDAAPAYAGQQVYYGYTDQADPPHRDSARITMVRGSGAAFGYLVSPAGEALWFARVPGPPLGPEELAGNGPDDWRRRLLPLLAGDRTPAAGLVAATGAELMATNAWQLTPGLVWRGPRTVLIGDAAHAASPATGQGASMALEDAVVLAKALRELPVRQALPRFEELRRPRVERNIEVSGALTARRPADRGPVADAERGSRGPVTRLDPELRELLDWGRQLPTR